MVEGQGKMCVFKELLGQMFPLVTPVQIQGNPTEAGGCPGFPLGAATWVWPAEVACGGHLAAVGVVPPEVTQRTWLRIC